MTTVASFGGGVNSTAMLIGCYERGEKVDLVLFADTGGEKPETYEHVARFSEWMRHRRIGTIITVREERWTLEEECLREKTLPSIVTGLYRSCSDKFKIRPQDRWLKENGYTDILKLVGFDAGEPWRRDKSAHIPNLRFPLIEWNWGREECVEAIKRHDLPVPPKSSCFFCPEMQEREILDLQSAHPDLLARALAMERNNQKFIHIKGLAREYSWQQVVDYHRDQMTMLLPPRADDRLPCICYDGSPDDSAPPEPPTSERNRT